MNKERHISTKNLGRGWELNRLLLFKVDQKHPCRTESPIILFYWCIITKLKVPNTSTFSHMPNNRRYNISLHFTFSVQSVSQHRSEFCSRRCPFTLWLALSSWRMSSLPDWTNLMGKDVWNIDYYIFTYSAESGIKIWTYGHKKKIEISWK